MPTVDDYLPLEFWTMEEQELLGVVIALLEDAAFDGVAIGGEQLAAFALAAELGEPTAQASAWAREHAGELIKTITDKTRRMVGEAVANWIETPGATLEDLMKKLPRILSENEYRAAMIATTETTEAYSRGSDLARREAGLPRTVFSPGYQSHPNCRCHDSPVQLDNGDWVVVWQTNRDEVVCRQPFPVPWGGEVAGCRGMQDRVISEGPYLGQLLGEIG
jgi:hypothetical protein